MDSPTGQDARSSLQRAFQLLETFTPERPDMSVRELARRSGIPRSTTHRIAQELVEWGALERTPGGLRIGVKLFELGTRAPSPTTLREAAATYLHTLNEVTGLTANLAILEGTEIVYVDKIAATTLRVPHSRLGGRVPAHATGLGKAILAFSPRQVVDQVIDAGLPAVTPHTVTDGEALRAQLHRIRRERHAYDVEESREGLFCVAAPVFGGGDVVLGAVSVTGATALSQATRFAPVVMATARSITDRLSRTRYTDPVATGVRVGHHRGATTRESGRTPGPRIQLPPTKEHP